MFVPQFLDKFLHLQFTLDKSSTQAIVYETSVTYFMGEYWFKQFFFQVHNTESYSVLDVSQYIICM